jgi:ferredoxin
MLVINPEGCFDCGVREPECPTEAIFADAQPGLEGWPKLNGDQA